MSDCCTALVLAQWNQIQASVLAKLSARRRSSTCSASGSPRAAVALSSALRGCSCARGNKAHGFCLEWVARDATSRDTFPAAQVRNRK